MSMNAMSKLSRLTNDRTKDASDLVRPTLLRNELQGRVYTVFWEDPSVLPFMAAGGDGIISVTNIAQV